MDQRPVAWPQPVLHWTLPRALVVSILAAGSLLPMMPVEKVMAYAMLFIPPLVVVLVPFYWLLADVVLSVFNLCARWFSPRSIRRLVSAAIVGHIAGLAGAVLMAIAVDQTIRKFAPQLIGSLAASPRGDDWYMLPIMVGLPPMGTLLGALITVLIPGLVAPPNAAGAKEEEQDAPAPGR